MTVGSLLISGTVVQEEPGLLAGVAQSIRWCRRNPALVAGVLAASLLVTTTAVAVGWAVHANRRAEDIRRAWSEAERAARAGAPPAAQGCTLGYPMLPLRG